MDFELQELISQIKTALDIESECLKAGVELWEIRKDADVELARDKFIVDEPIELNDRVKFCETVDDFVSTMAELSLSRKVMEVKLFKGSVEPKVAFLLVLLGPDDNGKTNIDYKLIELLSQAYDNTSI
jgi:hypothetical protein